MFRIFGRASLTALRLLFRGDFRAFKAKLAKKLGHPPSLQELYNDWLEQNKLSSTLRTLMQVEAKDMADPPRISILLPLADAQAEVLRGPLNTMQRQIYPHWELCVASYGATPDAPPNPLESAAASDKRIIIIAGAYSDAPAALNAALQKAAGQYVALLDAGDELAEEALYRMVQSIKGNPALDALYSDEDQLDSKGRRCKPFFKPDWSPEYFLAFPYLGRLTLYRASLARDAGGFQSECDIAQAGLWLRLLARGAHAGHVKNVLYHRRAAAPLTLPSPPGGEGRVRGGQPLPDSGGTGGQEFRKALRAYLEATGQEGTVEAGPVEGTQRLRWAIKGQPKVSIIIPSRCQPPKGGGAPYLVRCIESIVQKSTYKEYEILVLDRKEMPKALEKQLTELGARRVKYQEPFNWSRVNNLGAKQAAGSHLLFLNDGVEVITPDWLQCLLEYSQQAEIGAVGAKLLFPDGRLQHAGVFILRGSPGHPYYGAPGDGPGYFHSNVVPRNYSAVTGACLMTRAEVFGAMGGFDETFFLNYNDVDYCLKVVRSGRRVVCTPFAQLLHHEAVSKPGVFGSELAQFKKRWPEWCEEDPYFSNQALEFAEA